MKKNGNLLVLILLGIMWSTFAVFTKISAENIQPFFVSFARLAIGGSMLYGVCLCSGRKISLAKNFKKYFIVGFFNSAVPFTLFALSAKYLDSGVAAILDGSVPMFEVLIAALILRHHVDKSSLLGVLFGVVGIVVTSYGNIYNLDLALVQIVAIIAILVATASYAGASHYVNLYCKDIEPMSMATGSVIYAALITFPSVFFTDFSALANPKVISSLAGLGILCTGISYIFYFKLTAEEGPRIAVSVVLLIPVFGTIFGVLFLEEAISISKIIGCVMILVSMKFILNLSRSSFFRGKKTPDAI